MSQTYQTAPGRVEESINSWQQFNRVHDQNKVHLTDAVRHAHFLVYYSIQKLANGCDKTINFFNETITEFDIAKATKSFDINVLTELEQTMTQLLEELETEKLDNQVIGTMLEEKYIEKIKKEKDGIKSSSQQVSQKMITDCKRIRDTLIKNVVGISFLSMPVTVELVSSYPVLCGSAYFACHNIPTIIGNLKNYQGKADTEKHDKAADNLLNRMEGLQKDFVQLKIGINSMPLVINNYKSSVLKCITYATPENPEDRAHCIRVKKMAKNMISLTKAVKEKFEDIRDLARTKEKELQAMLICQNSHQLLFDPCGISLTFLLEQ